MSKVVVTGAAGFIGSNLVRALLKQGRDVRAIDNVSRGSKQNLVGLDIEIVHADLRDYGETKRAFSGVDCVYHLAARVGSIDYLHGGKRPELETLQSNLAIDTNVFRSCIENNIEKVVYASSVSVYPIEKQQKIGARFVEPEIYPINPEGGYGWAKLIGEIQLEMMDSNKSSIARIFNAYGEFSEYGKTAQVVPALIRKAVMYPEEDFIVWGDGTQTRNLIYIGDCVSALLKLEQGAQYPPITVNIGTPETTTIAQLANTIVSISGKDIKIKYDKSKPVGPISRIPDITLANKILDWEPKTSLYEGLSRTYEYMKEKIAVN